jgi:hypothetical protein
MTNFWLGALIGVAAVAIIAIPFRLPWPIALRWLIAGQSAHPLAAAGGVGAAVPARMSMREVALVEVGTTVEGIELLVVEACLNRRSRTLLVGARPAVGTVAMLDGWCAAATPLLLWSEPNGPVHLYSSHGAVTNLRRVEVAGDRARGQDEDGRPGTGNSSSHTSSV